jgi:low affinity Fe/Cu permease
MNTNRPQVYERAPVLSPSPSLLRAADTAAAAHYFSRFAAKIARKSGHIVPFIVATIVVVLWLVSGPLAHWSDTWQLVMNTISSAATFLMVFVIQGSQNRDTDGINAKLNEIIRSLSEARNEFLSLEDLSESQLQRLNAEFARLADH